MLGASGLANPESRRVGRGRAHGHDGMHRMRHIFAFAAPAGGLALALTALSLFARVAMGAPADVVVITIADAGKTVSLVVGERLTVKLDAQPGTGFAWQPEPASTSLLSLLGTAMGGASMPGSVQSQTLTFVAHAPGKGNLKLAYRRPWEKDAVPRQSFSVAVRIAAQ
jgi:inhibitor of cysteine peptidase